MQRQTGVSLCLVLQFAGLSPGVCESSPGLRGLGVVARLPCPAHFFPPLRHCTSRHAGLRSRCGARLRRRQGRGGRRGTEHRDDDRGREPWLNRLDGLECREGRGQAGVPSSRPWHRAIRALEGPLHLRQNTGRWPASSGCLHLIAVIGPLGGPEIPSHPATQINPPWAKKLDQKRS